MDKKKKLDRPVEEILSDCLRKLVEVTESGYWPFASPAPCSTEQRIKTDIEKAVGALEGALYWHREMFGRTGRDPMKCASMKISEG